MLSKEGIEYLKDNGWTEEQIERVNSAKKAEEKDSFTYTIHIDEFRKKMRDLGWDEDDIEADIAIAEDSAPMLNNVVFLEPYLIPKEDLGELYA